MIYKPDKDIAYIKHRLNELAVEAYALDFLDELNVPAKNIVKKYGDRFEIYRSVPMFKFSFSARSIHIGVISFSDSAVKIKVRLKMSILLLLIFFSLQAFYLALMSVIAQNLFFLFYVAGQIWLFWWLRKEKQHFNAFITDLLNAL